METNEKNLAMPTKILEISNAFVEEFFKTASPENKAWILENIEMHTKKSGNVKYFAGFRSDFAKKFFPELAAKKKSSKTVSLYDRLSAYNEAGKEGK